MRTGRGGTRIADPRPGRHQAGILQGVGGEVVGGQAPVGCGRGVVVARRTVGRFGGLVEQAGRRRGRPSSDRRSRRRTPPRTPRSPPRSAVASWRVGAARGAGARWARGPGRAGRAAGLVPVAAPTRATPPALARDPVAGSCTAGLGTAWAPPLPPDWPACSAPRPVPWARFRSGRFSSAVSRAGISVGIRRARCSALRSRRPHDSRAGGFDGLGGRDLHRVVGHR